MVAMIEQKEQTMQKKTGDGIRIDEACMIVFGVPGRGKINFAAFLNQQAAMMGAQLQMVDPRSKGTEQTKGRDDGSEDAR